MSNVPDADLELAVVWIQIFPKEATVMLDEPCGSKPREGGRGRRKFCISTLQSLIVVLFGLATVLDRIAHPAHDDIRRERHPPLLILAQRLVERLPSIGELLKIAPALNEPVRSALHKLDWIALVEDVHCAIVQFGYPLQPRLPVLRPSADGLFDGRPIFFLIGRQLQGGLEYADTHIRQAFQVGGAELPHSDAG
jgi:hypothetical protein